MDKTIETVLSEHTQRLMDTAGVVGVGIGLCDGEPCIRVFVEEELTDDLPTSIEGYRVDVLRSDEFIARE